MRSNKLKLSKKGKLTISAIVALITIITLIIPSKQEDLKEHEILESDNYSLKIDYPETENKEVAKIMANYINDKKEEFIKIANNKEQDFKYEFSATYSLTNIKDIEIVHIIIYAFTGGAHYTREDKSFYYYKDSTEFLDITTFLKTKESLNDLASKTYYYVMKYALDKKIEFNKENVEEGTASTIANYNHFSFNNEGLEIIFPPYQVSCWADGEIRVTIPNEELIDIIKEEYITKKADLNIDKPIKRSLNEFKNKKLIAFTFDDGPSGDATSYLLDNLDKYNARVTFFVLGSRVKQYESNLKRAYMTGNQIGSHTYSHLNLFKLNDYDILNEVVKTNEAIKNIIGVEPNLLRPPYGNINADIKKLTDMSTILWNIDTEDWKYKDKEKIADNIIKNAHDGAIVLLHDIYKTSVEGALLAMEKLEKEGYAFVTIEEIAKLKNIKLDKKTSYFNFK